jgi:DNA repair protein RecN (Recombination protein N)
MITEIQLENFLFMHKADLSFSKGLNVITGETGAGKSVLLEAVKLLLGKKSRAGIVLKGQKQAKIQAEFDIQGQTALQKYLEEAGFNNEEDPDTLSITRTFKEDSNGRVLVNGLITTSSLLKGIGPYLMEIHGQNEHQTLLDPVTQRELLDKTGNSDFHEKLNKLKEIYKSRKDLQEKLEELESKSQHAAERIEELEAIKKDLDELNLSDPNEEEELKETLKKLSNSEQIINALQGSLACLAGSDEVSGATMLSYKASEMLRKVADYDSEIEDYYKRITDLYYELKSLESDIEAKAENSDLDPEKLFEIQSRLSDIQRISRKYSTDFAGLFELSESCDKELSELTEPDQSRNKLLKELEQINKEFNALVSEVTKDRTKLAQTLNKSVSHEMEHLGFNSAVFEARLEPIEPASHGAENVEFYVSLNPGAPGGPLRKIASGGELSRVALAIKKVLANSDKLPTLVFDEIDTGIGGKTAEAVADSLRSLGEQKQVLLVTHLHQIAKEGTHHFTVTKSVVDNQTEVNINRVEGENRVEELARMLGRTDEDGLTFARSLLKS